MGKRLIITIVLLFFISLVYAGKKDYNQQQIEIKRKNLPHTEVNIPADMPDVYYDSELDVITIVDYVSATYYVTIVDDWLNVVITDTKPGGGTIDVSSLTSGDYTIEISTSWNHDYEGQFTVP